MTRDEILNMPAGREMDVTVGYHVMDLVAPPEIYPEYSTDIAAAWGVVEGQEEFYFEFKNGKYFAMIADNFETSNEADAAPLAICRAALLAVMPL
jgi:hypothetical protein